MARRNESIIDLFCILPWWVSILTAAIVYTASHYLIPTIQFENFYLKSFTPSAPMLGNIFSLLLLFCAAFSAANSFVKAKRLDAQKDINSIRALGWKDFEELVGEAYRRKGYRVIENQGSGPDGGIDLVLKKENVVTLVQCKQWRTLKVGVKVVRELFGVMTAKGAGRGIIIISGEFTKDAVVFAESNSIELINGPRLLTMICEVQKEPRIQRQVPVVQISQKECPTCGADMVLREARRGQHVGTKFWGCSNYPKCKKIIQYTCRDLSGGLDVAAN